MSLLFSIVGFAAQLIAIASIISIIISCVFSSSTDSALIGEDHLSGADPLRDVSDSDASLLDTARVTCAKSIISASYTVVIDEPVSLTNDLSCLTIRQLKALCKSRSVKGYGNLRKHELVELLSAL